MSTAAVPAYFIARRVAGQRWALFASALAVAIPPMLYTSVLMTENAFFPAFLLFVWALVAALERPTPLRQLAVFAALGLAYVFRAQAVALVPAILTAILLLALLNAVAVPTARARAVRRTVTDFWVSWALVVVVASASWSSRRRVTGRCAPCSAPTSGRAPRTTRPASFCAGSSTTWPRSTWPWA